jgi:hypothetical protein
LFDGSSFELAGFSDVANRSLVDFDTRWLGSGSNDNDPFAVFNHLLPGDDTLIGSDGNDGFAPGKRSDLVDGGDGSDEVAYRGFGRGKESRSISISAMRTMTSAPRGPAAPSFRPIASSIPWFQSRTYTVRASPTS